MCGHGVVLASRVNNLGDVIIALGAAEGAAVPTNILLRLLMLFWRNVPS